jgi:hypothetical protein
MRWFTTFLLVFCGLVDLSLPALPPHRPVDWFFFACGAGFVFLAGRRSAEVS